MSTQNDQIQSYCKVCGAYTMHEAQSHTKYCGTCGCEELIFRMQNESNHAFKLRIEYKGSYDDGRSFTQWKHDRLANRIAVGVLAFVGVVIVAVIILES